MIAAPLSLKWPLISTRLSGLLTAGGRKNTASTTLKTAELIPIPTVRETIATRATAGRRAKERIAIRTEESITSGFRTSNAMGTAPGINRLRGNSGAQPDVYVRLRTHLPD